jgi:hypothetical protein
MNILLGLMTMVVCLVLQALLAGVSIRYYDRRQQKITDGGLIASLGVIIGVMILLLVGIFMQIAIWAGLFQWLGEFDLFADAFYHSAVNFATLGYGDIVMSKAHRILGPLQAVNGVLMIGVSTALLMAAFQDALEKRAA